MRKSIQMNRLAVVVALLLLAVAHPLAAQEGGDLQAQILYAFQTEDVNHLGDLIGNLRAKVATDGGDAARYHLAHAEYRYALLIGGESAAKAEAAAADCVARLQAVLANSPKSAETLTLQAACYEKMAEFKTLEGVFLRARATDRLDTAYKIAPRNPRVLLMMATFGLAHAPAGSTQARAAMARLELAARLFERSSATRPDVPGWGHAEAYLLLGRELLRRGDLVGARNWIERALITAPDYEAAKRELAKLRGR